METSKSVTAAMKRHGKMQPPSSPPHPMPSAAHEAYNLLTEVLDSIHALAQEQPHPEPRIVELSESEMRKIYPERYTQ